MESGWCSYFAAFSRMCIKTSLKVVSIRFIISVKKLQGRAVSFNFMSPACCCGDLEVGLPLKFGLAIRVQLS